MKLDLPLFPSLAHIERRLFGVSDALMDAVERGETSAAIADSVRRSPEWEDRLKIPTGVQDSNIHYLDANTTTMPAHIRKLVQRRIAAMDASRTKGRLIPEAGQIVEVREIVTPRPGQLDWVMQVPLYVLLDAAAESKLVWYGWLVSAETDYAGWWDFVLQEVDAPFDPEAGMVQLWNPVRIYLPMAGRVVAQLTPDRLQAVRAMAGEFVSSDPPKDIKAWLGRVAVRETLGGLQVVTGSPLNGEQDPRRHYQHLYFHAAEAIREPARLAMTEMDKAASPAAALLRRLKKAAEGLGQTLVWVPRVAIAMSAADADEDLVWEGLVRIHILAADAQGAGHVEISNLGTIDVTAEVRRLDLVEERVTVHPGVPVKLAWSDDTTALIITVAGGRKLELPLHPSTRE